MTSGERSAQLIAEQAPLKHQEFLIKIERRIHWLEGNLTRITRPKIDLIRSDLIDLI